MESTYLAARAITYGFRSCCPHVPLRSARTEKVGEQHCISLAALPADTAQAPKKLPVVNPVSTSFRELLETTGDVNGRVVTSVQAAVAFMESQRKYGVRLLLGALGGVF